MFVYQARHTLKGQFENEFTFRENAVYRYKETLTDKLIEQGYHINRRRNGSTEYVKYSDHNVDTVVIDTVELV